MRATPSNHPGRSVATTLLTLVGLGLLCVILLTSLPISTHAQLLAPTATPTLPPGTGAVTGIAWEDLNGDGIRDPGEPGCSGMLITVTSAQVTASATSGLDGTYRLAGLQPGIYRLTAQPPAGYTLTTPGSFDLLITVGAIVAVDFGGIFVPTPTPGATEPPVLDVSNATPAFCGGVYRSDTHTGTKNVSRYSCRPAWDESGPEVVYRIELDQSQPFSATLLAADADVDLFLLRYAYPDSCIAAGDNSLAAQAEPGVYFLAVDGYQGAAGNFALRVTCPDGIQATPTYTPIPSPTPTATLTPTAGPSATPTATSAPRPVYLPLLLRKSVQVVPGEATLTFQQEADGYTGVVDTTLDLWRPTTAFGSDKEMRLAYSRPPKITTQMAPVLRFDLGMLPPNAQIIQAQLKLYLIATVKNDLRGEVHLLLRDWDEQTATWQQPQTGESWAQGGAQGAGTDFAEPGMDTQVIREGKRWYTFDVTRAVSTWVADSTQNNGLIVKALAGDSAANVQSSFASSNYSNPTLRPQLVVNYRVAGRATTP